MTERDSRATDVTPEVVHIGKLLDKVAEGRTRIPRFQRSFQWRPEQMRDLLDSIRRRFPIGSILVWETDRAMASQERVGPIKVNPPSEGGAAAYVLDGQQRLLTLLGTLRLPVDWKGDSKWRIFFDLEKNEFFHPKNEGPEPHHLPARALLGTFDFIAECRRISETATDEGRAKNLVMKAERVADIFRNYQLPVIRITEADLEAAVTIFARLNTRGRRMTPDQMVSALTYSDSAEGDQGFHLASEIDRILEKLQNFSFGGLDRVAVLRAILAAAERDIYDTDWTNLVEDARKRINLRKPVDECEIALGRAVDFLRSEGVTSDRLLPYALQVVLLAEFFRKCKQPADQVLQELRRWFWVTSFTGWFGTFNSSQANNAIKEMREIAEGKRDQIASVRNEPALQFPSRFDGRSARVRAFLLYLMSLNPLSLDKGEPLDSGGLLSDSGPRALRYVFDQKLSEGLRASPANRILLGASHRGQAWGTLRKLPAELRDKVFASHGIPAEAVDFLEENAVQDFIRSRLRRLVEGERKFMELRGVTPSRDLEPAEPPIDREADEG